ncbi:MAG: hypothetical protein ABSG41_10250 [Bryobacteraceae bacterium]|jgi:hypothetical protein
MFSPAVDYDKEQLDSAVAEIEKQFPTDIEYIRYTLDEDWAHDPALFFRVLLKDRPGVILDVFDDPRSQAIFSLCNRIMSGIRTAVRYTHLQPYFVFRWASEQAKRRDPDWE